MNHQDRRHRTHNTTTRDIDTDYDSGPEEYSVHGSKAWDHDFKQAERRHRERLREKYSKRKKKQAGILLAGAVLLAGLVWLCWSDDEDDDRDKDGKRAKARGR